MNEESLPIDRIRDLVTELARPHTENVWTGESIVALDRSPLLADLRRAIRSDAGQSGTSRSASSTRMPLDITAFEMYEDIGGRIEAFYKALTGNPPRPSLEETLSAWYVAYRAHFMSDKFELAETVRVERQLRQFVARIRNVFDPPRVKELVGVCPMCDFANVKSKEGAVQTALYASYRAGEEPVIRCRNCGTEWAGQRSLLEMGFHLGATLDEDALRQMGVIV